MLTVQEALERCLAAAGPMVPETVLVVDGLGRVLAADVRSPVALPPWDNSAMDGFAVRSGDVGQDGSVDGVDACAVDGSPTEAVTTLRVLETIAAGSVGRWAVEPRTASRIMTGAPMPVGADAVVMREHTEVVVRDGVEQVAVRGTARPGQHVRRAGEDVSLGDLVLPAGTTLDPGALGACAAIGLSTVSVARRPRVAILATGDEVVPTGNALGPGQIFASNSTAIAGLVLEAGGVPVDCGIAPDTLEGTRDAFKRALAEEPDLLLSTGGVSVGDFDVVKEAMGDVGAAMDFWKVAMKPGKPLAFGTIGGRPAFGLPGNPVSCMVNFLQFVRPVIRRALGDSRPFLAVVDAVLDTTIRRDTGRPELVRVSLDWRDGALHATSTGGQGSANVTSMARAHGFVLLAAETAEVRAGEVVPVQVFDGKFLAAAESGYRWR